MSSQAGVLNANTEHVLQPHVETPAQPLISDEARSTLANAVNHSFETALSDGHWVGELKSNATITAEYVFLRQALGLDLKADTEALSRWLLSDQNEDGSWAIAPFYPGDLSTTTEAYFALKILGVATDNVAMVRARDFIILHGGIAKVRIFTRIYLATFGLVPVSHLFHHLVLFSIMFRELES